MLWPEGAIYIPWDIFLVTWVAAAFWTARTQGRPSWSSTEIIYRVMTFAGFVALLAPNISQGSDSFRAGQPGTDFLNARYWALPLAAGWIMVAICAAGIAFCWWARLYLGRLWSARITRKEGHHVVDTGPYALVRHPIYTGIITAAVATAAERGSGYGVLGAISLAVGYWMKATIEERFLRTELGEQAYDAYARKTPMLVPFLKFEIVSKN